MARKNQILINYHTSGLTSMPLASEVQLGEIVVRHADERPELLVKTNNGDFAVIPASGAVASAINSAVSEAEGNFNTSISEMQESLSEHVTDFNSYKETAAETFATKDELSDAQDTINEAIVDAKEEVYASASTFATEAVATAKNELQNAIDGVESKVEQANSGTSILEQFLVENFATSADTVNAIAASKTEAIAAASAYTDVEIDTVYASASTFATNVVAAAKEEIQGEIDDVISDVEANEAAISAMSGYVKTTYATSAQTMDAIAVAKKEAIGAASAYTDAEIDTVYASASTFATNAIGVAKNELQGEIDDVISDVEANEAAISAMSGYVKTTYATSAQTVAAITKAKNDAIGAASAYTDAEIDTVYTSASTFATEAVAAAKEELQGAINGVASDVEANEAAISAMSGYVKTTYATSAQTVAAITKAKNDAIGAASAYTDAEIDTVYASASTFATNAVAAAKQELQGAINGVESALENGLSSVRGEMSAATEDLTELINNKVAVAYRYAGSCLYAELPASGSFVGEVWNVTDANGDFPAGTNYAWDGAKWDALGGSVDLSPYYKTADFEAYAEEVKGEFDAVRSEINSSNSGVNEFKEFVEVTYATSAQTVTAIANAKAEAIAAASAYTDAEIDTVYTSASTFATNAVAAAKEELQGAINGVASDVEANEAAISAMSGYVKTTYATSANTVSAITKAKNDAIGAASAYTDAEIDTVYASASTFTTSAITVAKNEIQGLIDGVSESVDKNTEYIKDVEEVADAAVQSFSANCGVVASNVATVGTFDFSSMIIDCGDF